LEPLLLANLPAGEPLAAYSFPFHFIWQGVFRYEWMELKDHICLMASNAEGSFLALPPLGPDPSGTVIREVFTFLAARNRIPALSRIENATKGLAEQTRGNGYRVVTKGPDYVYRREELVTLKGDDHKSQRVAFNHCMKNSHPTIRIYKPECLDDCLDVYHAWSTGVPDGATDHARHMAADAEPAHQSALRHATKLGLVGRVAEVAGRVAGYTFGYPLSESIFCVLLEITDRRVKGLSQFIFREFCRELEPYELINTMEDSGLEGLRRAKLAYHPIKLVESYIISPG
jgi:hypothetical protein